MQRGIDANQFDVFLNTIEDKFFHAQYLEAGGGWAHVIGLHASD